MVRADADPALYELPADHPGVSDPAYRARRATIAEVGRTFRRGDPIPDVVYTPEEDEVWRVVSSRARPQARGATPAGRTALGAEAVTLPADRVPQLREVDARVPPLTGFRIEPVPGLVPTREFYGSLADRVFRSTQYVRHHSVPFYTPEPDIVHEIIGHANMLGNPVFADLYQLAGQASRRAESDAALDFFSKVFWFTLEFGVVWEDGELRGLRRRAAVVVRRDRGVPAGRDPAVGPRPDGHPRLRHHPTTSRCCSPPSRSTAWSTTSGRSSPGTTTTTSPGA